MEAQRRRNEKRKGKFNGLLKQFNGIINSNQKSTFQERFNMAQEQRKLPKESRSNSASNIINKGGLKNEDKMGSQEMELIGLYHLLHLSAPFIRYQLV